MRFCYELCLGKCCVFAHKLRPLLLPCVPGRRIAKASATRYQITRSIKDQAARGRTIWLHIAMPCTIINKQVQHPKHTATAQGVAFQCPCAVAQEFRIMNLTCSCDAANSHWLIILDLCVTVRMLIILIMESALCRVRPCCSTIQALHRARHVQLACSLPRALHGRCLVN